MASILPWLPPALSQPRYRIFASGQAVSLFGNWIQNIALSWLIYRLSGSVFLLGVMGFVQQIPFLFVPPLAGMVADRLPRVRMILAIQVFITLIEFKLVTLAGFVLLPFAFFARTAFMAERVLGHIVSSGIKVLVLAVITGIGVLTNPFSALAA